MTDMIDINLSNRDFFNIASYIEVQCTISAEGWPYQPEAEPKDDTGQPSADMVHWTSI